MKVIACDSSTQQISVFPNPVYMSKGSQFRAYATFQNGFTIIESGLIWEIDLQAMYPNLPSTGTTVTDGLLVIDPNETNNSIPIKVTHPLYPNVVGYSQAIFSEQQPVRISFSPNKSILPFVDILTVGITTNYPGSTLYYTLDGSLPDQSQLSDPNYDPNDPAFNTYLYSNAVDLTISMVNDSAHVNFNVLAVTTTGLLGRATKNYTIKYLAKCNSTYHTVTSVYEDGEYYELHRINGIFGSAISTELNILDENVSADLIIVGAGGSSGNTQHADFANLLSNGPVDENNMSAGPRYQAAGARVGGGGGVIELIHVPLKKNSRHFIKAGRPGYDSMTAQNYSLNPKSSYFDEMVAIGGGSGRNISRNEQVPFCHGASPGGYGGNNTQGVMRESYGGNMITGYGRGSGSTAGRVVTDREFWVITSGGGAGGSGTPARMYGTANPSSSNTSLRPKPFKPSFKLRNVDDYELFAGGSWHYTDSLLYDYVAGVRIELESNITPQSGYLHEAKGYGSAGGHGYSGNPGTVIARLSVRDETEFSYVREYTDDIPYYKGGYWIAHTDAPVYSVSYSTNEATSFTAATNDHIPYVNNSVVIKWTIGTKSYMRRLPKETIVDLPLPDISLPPSVYDYPLGTSMTFSVPASIASPSEYEAFYTTDGTTPSRSSTPMSTPFVLSQYDIDYKLRLIVFYRNYTATIIEAGTYAVRRLRLTNFDSSIASWSIYYPSVERPTDAVEFRSQKMKLKYTGSETGVELYYKWDSVPTRSAPGTRVDENEFDFTSPFPAVSSTTQRKYCYLYAIKTDYSEPYESRFNFATCFVTNTSNAQTNTVQSTTNAFDTLIQTATSGNERPLIFRAGVPAGLSGVPEFDVYYTNPSTPAEVQLDRNNPPLVSGNVTWGFRIVHPDYTSFSFSRAFTRINLPAPSASPGAATNTVLGGSLISLNTPTVAGVDPATVSIYYTTNGTNPVEANFGDGVTLLYDPSTPLIAAIPQTIVKAILTCPTANTSAVATFTYNVPVVPTPTYYTQRGPNVSTASNTQLAVGDAVKINMVSNVTYYYTVDGTNPVPADVGNGSTFLYDDSVGYLFSSAAAVTNNFTIKSIGIEPQGNTYYSGDSAIASAAYTLARAATPVFSGMTANGSYQYNSASLTITSSGSLSIFYTLDGSTPHPDNYGDGITLFYTGPIRLAMDDVTSVKAIAVRTDFAYSVVSTFNYKPLFKAPLVVPGTSTIRTDTTVTMSPVANDLTLGEIHYTLNGTNPTEALSSTCFLYDDSNPPIITKTQTIKAACYKTGYAASAITTATYTYKNSEPVASVPNGASIPYGTEISITCASSPGCNIHYTTDNTNPTASSLVYSDTNKPIMITRYLRVIAITADGSRTNSNVVAYTYTLI